jgi:hypothetical protein
MCKHLAGKHITSCTGARCPTGPLLFLQRLEDLPKPHKDHLVKLQEEPEQFYASITFTGVFTACHTKCLGLPIWTASSADVLLCTKAVLLADGAYVGTVVQ